MYKTSKKIVDLFDERALEIIVIVVSQFFELTFVEARDVLTQFKAMKLMFVNPHSW